MLALRHAGATRVVALVAVAALATAPASAPAATYRSSKPLPPSPDFAVPPEDASATHIPDPTVNIRPDPDYVDSCAQSGIDVSRRCTRAALGAIDHARAKEGVKPMVLPATFDLLSVPEQLLVVIDRERVDRGLRPFEGLTRALDADAQQGADSADDPPDPGPAYAVVDSVWAGGASNALDADYGWMYDDGPGSANLDCPRAGAPGCWGHRHGILDDFGRHGTLVMGAAIDTTGDDNPGDEHGTSMAATLAITGRRPSFLYTWADALSLMTRRR
jgi:hypothetical protein